MKRIHDSLKRVFEQHRLVFWYDGAGEWAETFEAFVDKGVTNLRVEDNEFGAKVQIIRDPNPAARYLVYVPTTRPADADNWLLHLLLQGYEYKADKASLALQDVGLPHEFLHLAQEHAAFFRSDKRNQALKDLISKDDQSRDVQLKMMAVLAGAAVEVDAMLLNFLGSTTEAPLLDPVTACLSAAALVEPFWREVERVFGYSSNAPSLRDFVVSLFRGANPLDRGVPLSQHAKVFLKRWQDSQTHEGSFRQWSRQLEKDLHIESALDGMNERAGLGDSDVFEIFEKFTLHRLCQSFEKGAAAADLRAALQQRRTSFWQKEHEHGYKALENAVELRELLAGAELTMDSLAAGVSRYVNSWWRIDAAYRRCVWRLRRYGP